MSNFGERIGVIGSIYRLLGEGFGDDEIDMKLNLTEVKVRGCNSWISHFLEIRNREDLVLYASTAV